MKKSKTFYNKLNIKHLKQKELLMAIIRQTNLFSWKTFHDDEKNLGDLERFKLVIETIPDNNLMRALYNLRANGRNDHPIEAIWNSILASIIFQHKGISSLRRELKRNAQLRELCGFNPIAGANAVPSKSAYNRFLSNLIQLESLVHGIFDDLVKQLKKLIPKFGTNLAFDGKAIQSFGKPSKKNPKDGRREKDADWGKKTYKGVRKDGSLWEKVKSWFGFRLHLIADADSELPIAYKITKASKHEQGVIIELFDKLNDTHPEIIDQCEHAMGDKGYDSKKMICCLWEKFSIKPIIDIRKMWRDTETRCFKNRDLQNVTHDYKGTVFCYCPKSGTIRTMPYSGFEKDRETLKFLCPAKHYGIECKGASKCSFYAKSFRVSLVENRRIFTPVSRSSYKWKRLYNKRTSVERVNSRIDNSLGFEHHYIRGLKKMNLRVGLGLCVMLAIAVGRLRQNRPDLMRSLVKSA